MNRPLTIVIGAVTTAIAASAVAFALTVRAADPQPARVGDLVVPPTVSTSPVDLQITQSPRTDDEHDHAEHEHYEGRDDDD